MKPKTKLAILGLLILGMMVAVPSGLAKGCCKGEGSHKGWHRKDKKDKKDLKSKFFHKASYIRKHQDELGLSDAQADSIRDLKHAVKKSLILQSAQIEVLKMDIQSQLREYPVDVNAIYPLIDQKYELKKQKARFLVDAMAKLKGTLNADQYAKLKALWQAKKS